jgi:ketosteroid isomerase-like protein
VGQPSDKADKTTNLDRRWTTVWEKKGPNWLIVHEHFSAPTEPPK